jgi:murein DD-endopeptidase MepM/ murein hydrolase activator NlpD
MDPFTEEGAFHAGVDISSPYGVPVKATADGVVTFAGRLYAGYGLMIDLDHGRSVVTRYAHLSGIAVSEGQAVTAGEIIGYVGRSGRSTGSHGSRRDARLQEVGTHRIAGFGRLIPNSD